MSTKFEKMKSGDLFLHELAKTGIKIHHLILMKIGTSQEHHCYVLSTTGKPIWYIGYYLPDSCVLPVKIT